MLKAARGMLGFPAKEKMDVPMADGDVADLCDAITELNGKERFGALLHNVLTPQECQALVRRSEQAGYEQALVNVGGGKQVKLDDVRNNDRCIIDDPTFAEMLHQRILSKLQDSHPHLLNSILDWKSKGKLHAVGCNERLRILKYDPGCYFKPHFDGCYVRSSEAGYSRRGEISQVTILLYLNEGYQGGSTNFLNVDLTQGTVLDVEPRMGSVLLFEHDCYHEGAVLKHGRKYVVRTEIMYTTKGPGNEYSKGLYQT